MKLSRRSLLALGIFVILGGIVAFSHWFDTQRSRSARSVEKEVTVHVTNGGDRGPGTLREAMFLVAGATAPTTILLEVPSIKLESALPPLVNGHGVRLVSQASKTRIEAQALESGPVLDVSGPNTTIEGIVIDKCPAAAILVRAVRFHVFNTVVEGCDVGIDVADNAKDTLLERNRFTKNRIGIRFGASGQNTVVASNEFTEEKDAGLWAVHSTLEAHADVIGIHDNKFTEDSAGVVVGNIPVLVERNDFVNSHDAAVHIVGAGAVIRGNRIEGGASMGIVVENAAGALIEDNELEGLTAYGIMVRGAADTLVRSNRLHNCGYGLAFVLGNTHKVNSAVDNTIIAAKFDGIDIIGDSPILRGNQVLRAHSFGLHVEDFQPPTGQKVLSQPFLENNNFGDSAVSKGNAALAVQKNPQ